MAAYNTSSAYDLSVYENYTQKPRNKKPKLEVVNQKSSKRDLIGVFSPQVLFCFSIVITLICLMIYNQLQLNEITAQINDENNMLTQLTSEKVRISSELESQISLRSIGEKAVNELGMEKLDSYHTTYVYLYEDDKVNLPENTQQTLSPKTIFLKIAGLFN